jgi:hypothetical protein
LRMEPPRPDALANVRPGDAFPKEEPRRPAPPPPAPPPPAPPPRREAAPSPPPRRDAEPPQPPRREAAPAPPRREPPPPPSSRREPPPPPRQASASDAAEADDGYAEPPPPEPPPQRGRNRVFGDRPPLTEEGLRGFRDVVAETETLGEKTAQATKSARAAFANVPTDTPELDRVEPQLEPGPLRGYRDAVPPPRPSEPPARHAERQAPFRPPPPRPPLDEGPDVIEPTRSRKGLVAVLITLFVILGIGLTVFVMRDRIASLFGAMRGLAPQLQRDAAPVRPKITDRVGQDGQPATPPRPGQPQTTPSQPQQPLPAVAQRVVLYEEDPADPNGKRYVGSAIWRTETVSPGTAQAPELAIRCDVEIPERRLAMTLSMRRNTDQALPASHTVEVTFNLPADFPFGGISNVPGILMKQAEQTRGAPLSGLAVKVTSGFFLLGLSAVETEKDRNIQLLKERGWFDIPVVYNNGRRAIIAVEKGNPGERACKDAFAAWGQ